MRTAWLWAGLVAVGMTVAAPISTGRAQSGFWAVETNACTADGKRCVKGIVRDGPFTSRIDCERHAQQLLRQYNAAHLRVSYIRCVPLS